jgi:hypothetical protein
VKLDNTKPIVQVARVQQFIRSRFNPIRSADPAFLSQCLDQFKVGFLRQATLLWDAIIERDDLLSSVVPKRAKAAARNKWEISTVQTDDPAAEAHKDALEEFWNNITVTDALDENEQGEVSLLIRHMMSAVGFRYCVHEIIWKPGETFTAQFRKVPLWFFENTTGRLRYITTENMIYGEPMDPAAWSVAVSDGLMPACSVAWMYKSLSLKDWVIYNERHGMPGIHGKTTAHPGTDEWLKLVEAVENFATDWSLVTNDGATIEKIDLATQGQLPYPPLVERMDRAMAAIWRGADLSTMSAGSGSGEGASLQGNEAALIEEDDCMWLSETLRRNVDRRVIEYRFGKGVKPLAYISIKPISKQNIEADLKVDEALNRMGAPLSVAAVLERYGRTMPEADDQILPRPAPAVAPATGIRLSNSLQPSAHDLAKAVGADLAPLRAKIEAALALPDDQIVPALAKLRSDLPGILKAISADPKTAAVFEKAMTEAIAAEISTKRGVK